MIPGWMDFAPDFTEGVEIPLPEVHEAVLGKGVLPVSEVEGEHFEHTYGSTGVSFAEEFYGRAWEFRLTQSSVFGVLLLDSLDVPPPINTIFTNCATLPDADYVICGVTPNGAFAICAPVPNASFGGDMSTAITEQIYQILGGRPVVGDMLVGGASDLFTRLPVGPLNSALRVGAGGPEWSNSLTLATLTLGSLTLTTPLVWTSVNKTGSSLADLTTRSAADLSSGVLADARVQQSNVTQHQAALALAAAQITSGTFANALVAAGNVTQHQAALAIAWGQLTGVPATFTATAHAINSATHTGVLGYSQLPNAAGTWDVGNANKLTHNAVSYGWNFAGTEKARLTTDGISFGHTSAFDPLATLHLRRSTGTATAGVTPVAVRLHSTLNTNDHSTTLPWGKIEFVSDDAGGLGAGTIRAAITVGANLANGGETRMGVWVSSLTQLYEALSFDPGNGANFFIAPPGTATAQQYGRVAEAISNKVFLGATTNAVAATEVIGDLYWTLTHGTGATPIQGDLTFRLNTGDSLSIRARLHQQGFFLAHVLSVPTSSVGGWTIYGTTAGLFTRSPAGNLFQIGYP